MGNAGACSAFCTDLQKASPLVQQAAEHPCFSETAPIVQYVTEHPCFSEDVAGRFHLKSQGFSAEIQTNCDEPGSMSTPWLPSVHPEAAMAAVAALDHEAKIPATTNVNDCKLPPNSERQALDHEARIPATTDVDHCKLPPNSERQSVTACSEEANGCTFSATASDSTAAFSATASDSTAASLTPDAGTAQQVMKNFVRAYVKGRDVAVLAVDGGVKQCFISLDRKLTTLSLQRSGKKDSKKRGIRLEDISKICIGQESNDDVDLELDDLCVTLIIGDGQAVSFRLEDVEERDTFARCLSMFADGRRGEIKKLRSLPTPARRSARTP